MDIQGYDHYTHPSYPWICAHYMDPPRIPGYTMITRKSRDTIITSYPWIYDHYMDIQGYDHYRDPCNNRISRDTVPRDTIITCGCVWHRYDEFVSIQWVRQIWGGYD